MMHLASMGAPGVFIRTRLWLFLLSQSFARHRSLLDFHEANLVFDADHGALMPDCQDVLAPGGREAAARFAVHGVAVEAVAADEVSGAIGRAGESAEPAHFARQADDE